MPKPLKPNTLTLGGVWGRWIALLVAGCLPVLPVWAEGLYESSDVRYQVQQLVFDEYPGLSAVPVESAMGEELPPVPASPSEDTVNPSLEARLAELEAKYQALEESRDELASGLDRYVTTSHPESKLRVFGRINTDLWTFPGESPGVNGFESGNNDIPPQDWFGFRRLRLGALGTIRENMEYKIEMEFADGDDVEFRDAYLGFTDLPYLQTVRIGNQKRPYGLDNLNSSRYNVFMERDLAISAFGVGNRRFGIMSRGSSDDLAWNWRYGLYNLTNIESIGHYTSNHWQGQVAGRLANTMWYDELSDGRGYAHVGVSGTWANPNGNASTNNFAGSGINQAQFQTRPEARTESTWLDTGMINGADHYTLLGLENVVNFGAVQFCGEYQTVWLDRDNAGQLYFHGGYFYVSYFLTGEHMPWNRGSGTLQRIYPFENFFLVDTARDGVRGGWGAWQIAARYSTVDLADADIQGGIGDSVTLGLNWYWNPWSRMQFNYIYGNIHDNALNAAGGIDFGDYHIIGTRFAIDF